MERVTKCSKLPLIISLVVILILFIIVIVLIVLYVKKPKNSGNGNNNNNGNNPQLCSTYPPTPPDGTEQIKQFNQLSNQSSQEYWGVNGGQYLVMFFKNIGDTSGQYSFYVDSGQTMYLGNFSMSSNVITLSGFTQSIIADKISTLNGSNTTAYTLEIDKNMVTSVIPGTGTFLSDSVFLLTVYSPNK